MNSSKEISYHKKEPRLLDCSECSPRSRKDHTFLVIDEDLDHEPAPDLVRYFGTKGVSSGRPSTIALDEQNDQ